MAKFCKTLHLFRTNVHGTVPGVKTAQPVPGYPRAIKKHRSNYVKSRLYGTPPLKTSGRPGNLMPL